MASSTKAYPLPEEGKRGKLICSALPYVNNVPHLGNVIGSVLSADVYSRYCKARRIPTIYICGTDEYGTATETKAIEEGITPQALCDRYHKIHKEVYDWFQIAFDVFGRTPTPSHTEISQDMFLKLYKNGFLEERTTIQPFCETHSAFLADRFVEGECPLCGYIDARGDQCDSCGHLLDPLELIKPRCKLDGATPVPKETKHAFLRLDLLQGDLEKFVARSSSEGRWSANATSITETWLKEGLHARGITRDLKWGVPVPLAGFEQKVLYVWFEACIGYPSITKHALGEDWKKWWHNPENIDLYHFLGKDNVPFHAVIFPASQIGTGDKWTQVHHISATEYLQYEKGKFSKSRGIGVFGNNAKATGVPADVWRYYLLSHRPESGDSEFEWDQFIAANNNTLLKNLGNFTNRIIKFVNSKVYDNIVPDYTKCEDEEWKKYKQEHVKEVNALLQQYISELDAVKLRVGLSTALQISSLGNKLLQDNKIDNKLATEQPEKCAAVVGLALNHVHILASLISPYMPATTESILTQLNTKFLDIPDTWSADTIPVGHTVGKAAYLFSQIKPEKEIEWREMFGGAEARKAKEEAEAKRRANKEAKLKKKAAKKAGTEATASETQKESVETIEKGGKEVIHGEKDAVEAVTEGINQAVLQSS